MPEHEYAIVFFAVVWFAYLIFNVSARSVLTSPEVNITAKDTSLQFACCAINKRVDMISFTAYNETDPLVTVTLRRLQNGQPYVRHSHRTALAAWGALDSNSASLTIAWEQSDFLDLRFHDHDAVCQFFTGSTPISREPQVDFMPAKRWEWNRQKPESDSGKRVSLLVQFAYGQGYGHGYRHGYEASIPEVDDKADGTLKLFTAKMQDDVILYRSLDSSRGSLLALVLPTSVESTVENFVCQVKVDGHISKHEVKVKNESPTDTGVSLDCSDKCEGYKIALIASTSCFVLIVVPLILVAIYIWRKDKRAAGFKDEATPLNDLNSSKNSTVRSERGNVISSDFSVHTREDVDFH